MIRLFFVIAIVPVLVSCGLAQQPVSSGGPPQVLPDAVVVNRTNSLHQPIPVLNQITIQGEIAVKLYQDIEAMPTPKWNGPVSCPADFGVNYTLSFEREGKKIADAELDAAGCRGVTFNGQSCNGMSPAGDQLWKELGAALGLNDRQVHGVPGSYVYTPLANNPTKIMLTKNGVAKTITDPSIMKVLISKINQAGENTKKGMLHCNVITRDSYRIAVYYKNGSARVFENHGGACQPLVDDQNYISFLAGQVISDRNLM